MSYDTKRLVPKHADGVARVLVIGRLSKPKATEEETQATIESSIAVAKAHLNSIYDGPIQLTQLAEQASGLIVERATMLEAEQLIETGDIDLVITEELSRIYRSARHQYGFVEDCVDAGVRVICVADRLDTADEDWERVMGTASFIHSAPIIDARRRQKRKNIYAFHGGGNVQKIKYGYTKLSREQSASGEFGPVGLRIAKVAEATPIIRKMREILMTKVDGNYGYVPVLDWLIENKVPPGPYVTGGEWSQPTVKCLLTDPILIGVRRFRRLVFTRIRKSGLFRREVNPDGPETEHYPELAHLTDDEFMSMNEVIDELTEQHRNLSGSDHPLYRKSRKNAVFPRQHATCSICKGLMYAYDTNQLKCENAHARGENQCWNHVQVNMTEAQTRIVDWLMEQFEQVAGFRPLLADFAKDQLDSLRAENVKGRSSTRRSITQLEREATIVAKALRAGGDFEALLKESEEIQEQLNTLRALEQRVTSSDASLPTLSSQCDSDEQIREALLHLAGTSHEFASLMRQIIPQFEIIPVQAIDSGLVRPRARLTLSVERLCKVTDPTCAVPEIYKELDLFEPPKHFRFLKLCQELKQENPRLSYKKIEGAINERLALSAATEGDVETISYMTVKRCLGLARMMESEGLTEPYRILTEQPANASRWNPRR